MNICSKIVVFPNVFCDTFVKKINISVDMQKVLRRMDGVIDKTYELL